MAMAQRDIDEVGYLVVWKWIW